MFKGNINYNMIDIFLSSPEIFAQDAATKLIVTIQEIKKLCENNSSRKFEDLDENLKKQLTVLSGRIIYIQEISIIDTMSIKPFIENVSMESLENLTVEQLFEFCDDFCENIDVDSYNLQVKEIITMIPPANN